MLSCFSLTSCSWQAHARNLSIGIKNDITQLEDLEEYYDWAINECEKELVKNSRAFGTRVA